MSLPRPLLRAAREAPMLSAEEERDLACRSLAGDRAAAERLMQCHFRFVLSLARRYRGAGVSFAELVQEGMVGLCQAVRRFDADNYGTRFSSYASWWIRSAMQDHVVRSWSLVRIGTTNAQKAMALAIRRKLVTLDPASGGEADSQAGLDDLAQNLAQRFAIPLGDVRALIARLRGRDLTLDAPADSQTGQSWSDRLPDPAPSPEIVALEKSELCNRRRLLVGALQRLDPRERLIIVKRHLSDLAPSLETLAHEMSLSKERVRVLEKKALAKLRALMLPARMEG